MQERITPKVISRLTGDWYEDYVETAKFVGGMLGTPQKAIDREVAKARLELANSPPKVIFTVMANADFYWGGKKERRQLQPREWVIALQMSEGCAQIYSIDGKFYRGSREYFYVRLVRKPPHDTSLHR
jgi:hypothetical protein